MDLLVMYTSHYTQTIKAPGTDHGLYKTYIKEILDELAKRKGIDRPQT